MASSRRAFRASLWSSLSTLLPDAPEALAANACAQAGADFVDCPVGGTVAPALKGSCSAWPAARTAAFARAKPVLEQLLPPGRASRTGGLRLRA